MTAQLIVSVGPDKGLSFPLLPGRTLEIGRNSDTGHELTDPTVSRSHCRIEVNTDEVLLHNLSAKGTFVNGEKTDKCHLQPNDVVRMGSTHLQYLVSEPTLSPEPEAPQEISSLWAETLSPSVDAMRELVGQRFGQYQVLSIIAKRRSGMLFKARDIKEDQLVALKVMPPEFAEDEEDKQRFIRAMKTMHPVRHPNIIAISNAGKLASYCWMAMEYFEGENLTEVIKHIGIAGILDWRLAYRVAVQIGRALEYAHERSIIHRNVTPSSILWRASDKMAKLSDLMLAKALEGRLSEDVTMQGKLVGNVAYMAPERTRGTGTGDGRSDLYGLGATLYALVTGQPPFLGKSQVDIIAKIHKAEPVEPRELQQRRSEQVEGKESALPYKLLQLEAIPNPFEKMILRLLAKKPEKRYQTATEMLALLDRIGQSQGLVV